MSNGPDFSHGGEFVEWDNESSTLDEHFPALVELARLNIGVDVELVRWSPDDPLANQYAQWWARQGNASRRHVGPLVGMKVVARSRVQRKIGMKIGYVRFNRTRPVVVRDEVAS